ncbi:hypothetical protein [Deinococcus sp. Marseille-Q6407]|uniref:hypothetical protein n=1 Tax=Deinococcus sp. Marseille-Q6407 TaxID=2969223 RepID=UPI0021C1B9FC|nr:hypothetical protein [Deinococcus sp. Marseille-Q6407]
MRNLLFTAALLLATSASAGSTPIRELMQGSGRQVRLDNNMLMVGKRTSAGKDMTMGVAYYSNVKAGRLDEIYLLTFRSSLSVAELDLLGDNVARIAKTCFNLSADRKSDIKSFLRVYNDLGPTVKATSFGPMKLVFDRGYTESGPYTAVRMSRYGTPGVAPWVNYCVK